MPLFVVGVMEGIVSVVVVVMVGIVPLSSGRCHGRNGPDSRGRGHRGNSPGSRGHRGNSPSRDHGHGGNSPGRCHGGNSPGK